MERRGKGARKLELALFRVDGAARRIRVAASRPLNEARAIQRLFRERLLHGEPIDPGFGFDLMRLSCLLVEDVEPSQPPSNAPSRRNERLARARLEGALELVLRGFGVLGQQAGEPHQVEAEAGVDRIAVEEPLLEQPLNGARLVERPARGDADAPGLAVDAEQRELQPARALHAPLQQHDEIVGELFERRLHRFQMRDRAREAPLGEKFGRREARRDRGPRGPVQFVEPRHQIGAEAGGDRARAGAARDRRSGASPRGQARLRARARSRARRPACRGTAWRKLCLRARRARSWSARSARARRPRAACRRGPRAASGGRGKSALRRRRRALPRRRRDARRRRRRASARPRRRARRAACSASRRRPRVRASALASAGSASKTTSAGWRARASASVMPALKPSRAATISTPTSRRAFFSRRDDGERGGGLDLMRAPREIGRQARQPQGQKSPVRQTVAPRFARSDGRFASRRARLRRLRRSAP